MEEVNSQCSGPHSLKSSKIIIHLLKEFIVNMNVFRKEFSSQFYKEESRTTELMTETQGSNKKLYMYSWPVNNMGFDLGRSTYYGFFPVNNNTTWSMMGWIHGCRALAREEPWMGRADYKVSCLFLTNHHVVQGPTINNFNFRIWFTKILLFRINPL